MTTIAAAPRLRLVTSQDATHAWNEKKRRDAGQRPIDASASDEVLVGAIGRGDRAAMAGLFRRDQTRVQSATVFARSGWSGQMAPAAGRDPARDVAAAA